MGLEIDGRYGKWFSPPANTFFPLHSSQVYIYLLPPSFWPPPCFLKNGTISGEAMRYLTNIVDGDARSAINTLQLVMDSREGESQINLQHVKVG